MSSEYQHLTGDHCGSASLRNLADYYGWGTNEAACFGLGAGIGFGYHRSGPASRMIMGRTPYLETTFFDTLGIETVRKDAQSRDEAWEGLEGHLESGPVLCFVDLFYLPYFESSTHFGPHTVVVTDVDEDAVTISDSEFPEPQTVDRASFDDAWSSDHGFWPLGRRWLAVDEPEPTVPTDVATVEAIERATNTMLDGDGEGERSGVTAIRAFADDLPTWTSLDDVGWTARFAYQNIERRGTGGGAFRQLYATFLETLGTDAGLTPEFGERMHRIADDWTSLGEELKAVSETDDTPEREKHLQEASTQARELAEREKELFEDLETAV